MSASPIKRLSTLSTASVTALDNAEFGLPLSHVASEEEIFTDPLHRLYRTPKTSAKPPPDPNQALVSDLPSNTLKWIKRRRTTESEQKVVLSHQAERQLREMFNSLDFNGSGTIPLDELTEAIAYVSEKTKGYKGLQNIRNLGKVFAEMDDNGDGTLDFAEFTHGMTGTANSALEKANTNEIERLFSHFVEYGEMRHRAYAIRNIEENLNSKEVSILPSRSSQKQVGVERSSGKYDQAHFNGDLQSYQNFKTLFGNEESLNSVKIKISSKSEDLTAKKVKKLEELLDEFVTGEGLPLPGLVPTSPSVKNIDPEYVAVENRLKEMRKLQIELHYNDPDLVAATKRKSERKKSALAMNTSARRASSLILNESNSLPTLELPTKDEMNLHITAKREAYEALRGFTVEESHNLMHAAQAMTRSRKNGDGIKGSANASPPNIRTSVFNSQVISLSPTRVSYVGSPLVESFGSQRGSSKSLAKRNLNTRSSLCFGPPPS